MSLCEHLEILILLQLTKVTFKSSLEVTFPFQSCSPSHYRDERSWRVEFSTEAYNLLNALEQIGYKVITSSSFVTGHKKFDTKVFKLTILQLRKLYFYFLQDYIWTLYRPNKCDIEM